MDKLIENGIIELIGLFRENTAQFEYEIDLCHLFHDILVEKFCGNNDFKIRWELKSKMPYKGKQPSVESKHFAKYDISLIIENSGDVPYAFEFKLFKDLKYDSININYFKPSSIKNIVDDGNKLTNPDNKVENGYILAFVYGRFSSNNRRRITTFHKKFGNYENTFNELVNLASKYEKNLKVVCVYSGEIEGEEPIFNILLYPDSFCAALNQKEGNS